MTDMNDQDPDQPTYGPDEIRDKNNRLVYYEKGQSGNSSGRPVGALGRSTIAKRVLAMKAIYPDHMFPMMVKQYPELNKVVTMEEMMTISVIDKAIRKGDYSAYREIMDTRYGKQKDVVEHAQPILIEVNIGDPKELLKNDKIE